MMDEPEKVEWFSCLRFGHGNGTGELLCGPLKQWKLSMAGHGEYMRNKQGKKRRQGVQLAGKRSGAEGPGFGIHCFIINNPGDIDPWLLVASLTRDVFLPPIMRVMRRNDMEFRGLDWRNLTNCN